ncbi:response regulator [bacterium]|nr:response regulator [bacterium]
MTERDAKVKKRILVVDDDRTLLELLKAHLQRHDYNVVVAEDGAAALRMAYQSHPDLIILDIMMPEISGIEVCKRLREMSNTPIIMLTALSQENYVIKALDAGADDYVRKPYTIGELLARIKVQFRTDKHIATNEPPAQLVAGDVLIDLPKRKVSVRGAQVDLTPTEYDLLVFMARHHDEVLTHERLLREGWGPEYIDQLDYLRLYIRYLRNKIETNPSQPEIIKTERGIGYYMNTFSDQIN